VQWNDAARFNGRPGNPIQKPILFSLFNHPSDTILDHLHWTLTSDHLSFAQVARTPEHPTSFCHFETKAVQEPSLDMLRVLCLPLATLAGVLVPVLAQGEIY
jgi:hypothetical protein